MTCLCNLHFKICKLHPEAMHYEYAFFRLQHALSASACCIVTACTLHSAVRKKRSTQSHLAFFKIATCIFLQCKLQFKKCKLQKPGLQVALAASATCIFTCIFKMQVACGAPACTKCNMQAHLGLANIFLSNLVYIPLLIFHFTL